MASRDHSVEESHLFVWMDVRTDDRLLFLDSQASNQQGVKRLQKDSFVGWHLYFLFLWSDFPHCSSRFISHSRVSSWCNANKTAAQILRRLSCQPLDLLRITHLNNAWWETGSGGVSDYTVFIPNVVCPCFISLPFLSLLLPSFLFSSSD